VASGIRRRLPSRGQAQSPPGDTLETLRGLLVGPEQKRLTQAEAQLVTPARVAQVLPDAVASTRGTAQGEALSVSLEPTITLLLRTLARKEAALFGEILSPTIGAAVRKAVSDAIALMLERFNEALERSLSLQSVRWRVEARRTGTPFAEVVMLHTLVYRVEEVFMIHPRTGLLLEHVADPMIQPHQPDQIAAMLEAIDSYVREAFDTGGTGHLSRAHFDSRTLWIDRSDSLAVAAIVQGVAPHEFGDLLRETRERLSLNHQSALAHFTSDVAPFAAARPALELCLRQQRKRPPQRAKHLLLASGAAVLIALIAMVAAAIVHGVLARRYARLLAAQPGVFVTDAHWSHNHVQIEGFRDPLADSPNEVLAQSGLKPADVHLVPFYSLDPKMLVRHARQVLQPPKTVALEAADGTLRASGVAPREWVQRAQLLSSAIEGVQRFDDSGLRSREDLDALQNAIDSLESKELRFALESSRPSAPGELARAATLAHDVVVDAARARLPVCFTVTGYADPTGRLEANRTLSQARADHVIAGLVDRGLSAALFQPVAGGIRSGAPMPVVARSVTFRVAVGASRCGESP
jgi:OOP family OmpA-OmpF porin